MTTTPSGGGVRIPFDGGGVRKTTLVLRTFSRGRMAAHTSAHARPDVRWVPAVPKGILDKGGRVPPQHRIPEHVFSWGGGARGCRAAPPALSRAGEGLTGERLFLDHSLTKIGSHPVLSQRWPVECVQVMRKTHVFAISRCNRLEHRFRAAARGSK